MQVPHFSRAFSIDDYHFTFKNSLDEHINPHVGTLIGTATTKVTKSLMKNATDGGRVSGRRIFMGV
jgi:hypothetical protein